MFEAAVGLSNARGVAVGTGTGRGVLVDVEATNGVIVGSSFDCQQAVAATDKISRAQATRVNVRLLH